MCSCVVFRCLELTWSLLGDRLETAWRFLRDCLEIGWRRVESAGGVQDDHLYLYLCLRLSVCQDQFVRFANGLMNETNKLVALIMEKLPEIRTTQLQMADGAAWGALSEEQKQEVTERHEENERMVKGGWVHWSHHWSQPV